MTTEPTPGPWMRYDMEFATIVTKQKPGRFIALCDGGLNTKEENDANTALIIRLANLFFAGTTRAEDHTTGVLTRGDMPADPDYGLTENEIAAARMLNALSDQDDKLTAGGDRLREAMADEIDRLKAINTDLLKALELILPLAKGYAPKGQTDAAKRTCRSWIASAEDAIAKAEEAMK